MYRICSQFEKKLVIINKKKDPLGSYIIICPALYMWALCVLAVTRCKTWALYVLAVTRCKTCGHCVYWLLDKRVGIVYIGCYEMLNVLALCVLAVTRC